MNDNIKVINKAGEGMETEGIAYIEIPSTTKKYVFYTLNEKVDNDLTKIYIAETNADPNLANAIPDTEWEDLRNKMIKISHKENVEDVNFLSMTDVTFNVGDPKKLAITAVAKQAFKDAQLSHTMSTNKTETPVTTGSSPFFNQEIVGQESSGETSGGDAPSIFANPPQPEIAQPEPVVPTPPTPPVASVPVEQASAPLPMQESLVEPVLPTNQELVQPVMPTPPVPPAPPVEPPIPSPMEQPAPMPAPPAFNIPQTAEVAPELPTAVEQVQEIAAPSEPVASAPTEPVLPRVEESHSPLEVEKMPPKVDKPIITDEEALKAINLIQEYINQESENNNH